MHLAGPSLLLALSLAPVAAPQPAGAQEPSVVAGCFQFDSAYFRWFIHDTVTSRMTSYSTDSLRLLPEAHWSRSGWTVEPIPVIADSLTRLRYGRFGHWSVSGDSVQVTWTSGFHGFSFRLSGRDTLSGTVLELTDAIMLDNNGRRINEPQPRPVKAWRIACR
jgi:hypothetical protein